jgi:hypothetical protein
MMFSGNRNLHAYTLFSYFAAIMDLVLPYGVLRLIHIYDLFDSNAAQ